MDRLVGGFRRRFGGLGYVPIIAEAGEESRTVSDRDAPGLGCDPSTYSCRDLREHRETFPSWLMLQARRLQDPQREINYEQLASDLGEPVSLVTPEGSPALGDAAWWLRGLQQADLPGLGPLLQAYPMLAEGRRAEDERASVRFTQFDGFVPAAAERLDPRRSGQPVSSSRLEKLAACPFSYFLESGLRLRPLDDDNRDPDEWLDPRTRGSELHALYAAVMRRLRRLTQSGDAFSPQDQAEWLRLQAADRLAVLKVELPPPSEAVFERERDQILRDMALFLDYETKYGADDRQPIGFEVAFGVSHGRAASDAAEPLSQREPIVITLGDVHL